MKTSTRLCKECGEPIDLKKGRMDRIFCDYECKNKYHNKESYADKMDTERIKKILNKNRKILKKMAARKDADQISGVRLLKAGFEFDYHTHFKISKVRKYQYTFCYDYGYRPVDEKDTFKVVKAFADKEE